MAESGACRRSPDAMPTANAEHGDPTTALTPCRTRRPCVTAQRQLSGPLSGGATSIEGTGRQEKPMFERFTARARRVVVLAQEEARGLNHNYIGTEHILLGLIHEGEGVASKALESLGISLEAVREQVQEIIGQGQQAPTGHIPFTPRAKKVLELSLREALQLGHNYIGTEHIQFGRNLTTAAREGKLDPVIGREKEIERVMQVLSRRTKNNPVLIGEPGVGKTAIVEGLSQAIVKGE